MAYVEPEILIELFNEGIISEEEYEVQIEENYDILNSEVVKVVKKVRKNLSMSSELSAWYDEKAKKIGITTSSMMVMALADYRKQEDAMSMINKMSDINNSINERERLKKDLL